MNSEEDTCISLNHKVKKCFYFTVLGRLPKEPIDVQRTMYFTLKEIKDLQRRGADEVTNTIFFEISKVH